MVDHEELFRKTLEIHNGLHWDRLGEIFTEDFVEEYPQSGEVFRGLEQARGIRSAYPGLAAGNLDEETARLAQSEEQWVVSPMFAPVQVQGSGATGTTILRVRYPNGERWWLVMQYEVRGDRICHATDWFAPEFPAPDWRAPFRDAP